MKGMKSSRTANEVAASCNEQLNGEKKSSTSADLRGSKINSNLSFILCADL